MRNTMITLIIGSFLILSGCSAKEEIKKQELDVTNEVSEVSGDKTEVSTPKTTKATIANVETPAKEVKPKVAPKKDRSGEIKAPDFTLATISGETFKLSDYSGKVVMLNFWGTWCAPCRREIPDLINLQNKYQKDGLEIVGITLTSGSAADIKKFADNKNMNYTILTDIRNNETQNVSYIYGRAIGQQISSIPTTLIIDREGYIVSGYLGPRTEEVFYNGLKKYL